MTFVLAWAAALAVLVAIDLVWLPRVMRPLFERHIGGMLLETPKMGVAAIFYVVYCAGLVYFAAAPAAEAGMPAAALRDGALLGALAYATYECTNWATLKGWHWRMAALDIAGGAAIAAVSAFAAALVLA